MGMKFINFNNNITLITFLIALAGCTLPQYSGVGNGRYRNNEDSSIDNTERYQRINLDAGREFNVPELPQLSSYPRGNTSNTYDNPEAGVFPPEHYFPFDAGNDSDDSRNLDAIADNNIPPEESIADAGFDAYGEDGSNIDEFNNDINDAYVDLELSEDVDLYHIDLNDSDSLDNENDLDLYNTSEDDYISEEESCAVYDTPGNNNDEDCDGNAACPVPCVEDDQTKRQECGSGQGGWRTHGMYVSCVAHYANFLRQNDIITDEERSDMINEAAHSDIGR